ncbi:holo-ACP synthase [Helicobacter mesocricetorum]|uniref:holo-ACP synthase n=1 Tax=Helicobacter mesocricetorum TaxID=87012 RepID=UPI000CF17611|nr:holo-ACP synthase [Helicobacter mesocricetorum]
MIEVGIDLVSIKRIELFIQRFGEKGLLRFLTPQEIAITKTAQNVAGFWAAKEACSKALKCGISKELTFYDILISKSPKGAPLLTLTQDKIIAFNLHSLSLSITHDNGLAIAIVAANFKIK